MQKLSLVIITFNEEKNIDRCLKSAQGIADEIIVVDSYSTDNTIEICKAYQAKIFQKEWMGYSEQKNYGNNLASHDIILSMDADEALSKKLSESILSLKESGFSGSYSFNRLNNYCGKWIRHTSWYPDTKLRIWNKKEGQWKGDIHETIFFENEVENKYLEGDLLHYSYYSINEHILQANKFSEIAAETKFKQGKKVSLIKIIFSPFFKFLKEYFFKLGLLDGIYGFAICIITSHETFLKYLKLYLKHHSKS